MAVKLTRDTILQALREHRAELKKLGVRRIGLFGSFLGDRPRADSDVDLLIAFEKPSFDDYMDTKFFLEDLFGRRVDLVTEAALKPALQRLKHEAAYAEGY